jgi:hypothetical protein
LAAVVVAVWFYGDLDRDQYNKVTIRWPREGNPTFASHFAAWDTAHYLFLSEVGYRKGAPSCAFYPLWPLTVQGFSVFTGGSHLLAGMLLANVFSLIGFLIFHKMVCEHFSEQVARLSLVFLLAFPGSLFFQFHYTEGLFFMLLMALWSSLEKRRYGLAWIMAFLLPMTRAIGLFCLFPIAWHLLTHETPGFLVRRLKSVPWVYRLVFEPHHDVFKIQEKTINTPESRTSEFPFRLGPWWLLCAPLTGWCCYLAFMKLTTGNFFEGFKAQEHWGVQSIGNILNISKFVLGFLEPAEWHAFRGSVLDRCAFVLLLYCLLAIWRLDRGLFIWAWVLGVVPAMSGTFTSFTRFESMAFPIFIALGVVLSRPGWRFVRWSLIAVFVVLHLVLVWRFLNFRWAG